METPNTNPRPRVAGLLRHGLAVVFSLSLLLTIAVGVVYLPASQRLLIAATPVEGFSAAERIAATKKILAYYSTGDGQLLSAYTPDERAHLAEVAGVIKKAWRIYATLLMVTLVGFSFVILRHGFSALRSQLHYACKVSTIGSLLILLIGWLGFAFFFDRFHQLVFSAAPWQFDPAVSRLVNEFPPEYFRAVVVTILSLVTGVSLCGWLWLRERPPPPSPPS